MYPKLHIKKEQIKNLISLYMANGRQDQNLLIGSVRQHTGGATLSIRDKNFGAPVDVVLSDAQIANMLDELPFMPKEILEFKQENPEYWWLVGYQESYDQRKYAKSLNHMMSLLLEWTKEYMEEDYGNNVISMVSRFQFGFQQAFA